MRREEDQDKGNHCQVEGEEDGGRREEEKDDNDEWKG